MEISIDFDSLKIKVCTDTTGDDFLKRTKII